MPCSPTLSSSYKVFHHSCHLLVSLCTKIPNTTQLWKGRPPEITKYQVGRLQKMTESKPWFCERMYSFRLSRSRGLPVHSLVFRTLWPFWILCWQKLGVGKNNETYYITHIPRRIIAHGSVLHPGLQEKIIVIITLYSVFPLIKWIIKN